MEPPHLSPSTPPQYCPPVGLQVAARQPVAGMHWLFLQTWSAAHAPQSLGLPQSSPMVPQYLLGPLPHSRWMQVGPPVHRPFVHTQSAGQAPHESIPPMPFPMFPQ
jgi:hypothetical protein